jgi:hypothetical protein
VLRTTAQDGFSPIINATYSHPWLPHFWVKALTSVLNSRFQLHTWQLPWNVSKVYSIFKAEFILFSQTSYFFQTVPQLVNGTSHSVSWRNWISHYSSLFIIQFIAKSCHFYLNTVSQIYSVLSISTGTTLVQKPTHLSLSIWYCLLCSFPSKDLSIFLKCSPLDSSYGPLLPSPQK